MTKEKNIHISELVDTSRVITVETLNLTILEDRRFYFFGKRFLDIVLSTLALVVCSIPMVIVALAVKLDSPGPIFYKQERLGLNGKKFYLVKFRSMKVDAEIQGAKWAQRNDPRVTRVGKIIRAFRLDELPQLWQVLTGDMALVGPRPEREIFYDEFEKYIHGFRQRLLVKPGITGLAQVSGGYELKPAEKIVYDIEYIKKMSVFFDIKVLLKTVVVVLLGHQGGAR